MTRFLRKIKRFLFSEKRISIPFKLSVPNPNSILINSIIDSQWNPPTCISYLEIGIEHGITFENVKSRKKVGVDPNPLFINIDFPWKSRIFKGISDDFFQSNLSRHKFSMIYIDGLHTFEQVLKDFINSSKSLTQNGLLLIDDTLPSDKYSALDNQEKCYQLRYRETGSKDQTWHGDVYKLVVLMHLQLTNVFDWVTVSDAWNPKTLVRVKSESSVEIPNLSTFDPKIIQDVKSSNYEEIFQNQTIPKIFNPITTNEISSWLEGNSP